MPILLLPYLVGFYGWHLAIPPASKVSKWHHSRRRRDQDEWMAGFALEMTVTGATIPD